MEARKILSPGGVLPFNARAMQGTYGVLLQYSPSKATIHYETECEVNRYLSGKPELLFLDRKKVSLENLPAHGKIYEISMQMAASVYPLQLVLSPENKLDGLINRAEVARRVDRLVGELWSYYPDTSARRCLELFKTDVASPNFLQAIGNDFFFQLHFYPLYVQYSEHLAADGSINLPIDGGHTRFSTTATLTPPHEANKKIEINLTGYAPGRHKPDVFSARYLLFDDDHSISSIKGTLQYEGRDRQPHGLTFEIYRLDPEKRIPLIKVAAVRKKPSVFICVEEEPPAPKSFFDF